MAAESRVKERVLTYDPLVLKVKANGLWRYPPPEGGAVCLVRTRVWLECQFDDTHCAWTDE